MTDYLLSQPHTEPDLVPPMAQALLEAFGRHIGVSTLGFDANGECGLQAGEHVVTIQAERDNEALVLRAEVAEAPAKASEAFLARLLVGNFSTAFAGFGTLALDAARRRVVLLSRLPLYGLTPAPLQEAVERLATGAGFWKRELEAAQAGSPDNTPA
ncbi:type III secretion system chaperone [Pseudochelatococcus sp. B33]